MSNDNPYSESLFRTLKYCLQWPQDGFAGLDAVRAWVRDFMRRGPATELYERAKEKNPERWSDRTRNWEPIDTSLLNPVREQQVEKRAA